jgi:hypothetical protein
MKASPILLQVRNPVLRMPEEDRAAVLRFFSECLVGADPTHDRRLRRMVNDWFRAKEGEGFQLFRAEVRSGPFHRRHRGILSELFKRQERYSDPEAMHDWLKLECWFIEWVEGHPKPRSTDYDSCTEDEIREFNTKLTELLHDPRVQCHFWPHLPDRLRLEQVEAILRDRKEPHER